MKKINQKDYEEIILKAKKLNKEYLAFESILDYPEVKEGELKGIVYTLQHNISTKGILTTGSSKILSNYVPTFDASVYTKLKEAGAILLAKTSLDELGINSLGKNSSLGVIKNYLDKERLGVLGATTAINAGLASFGIASDSDGSLLTSASYSGLVAYKGSYGRISRHGLFALASSLDHLGILANNVSDLAQIANILKGKDSYDMTSLEDDAKNYNNLETDMTNKKFAYLKSLTDENRYNTKAEKEILIKFKETLELLKANGLQIEALDFDEELLKAVTPVTRAITAAETLSNTSNLNGIVFGQRSEADDIEEVIIKSRTEGLSFKTKKEIILGGYILLEENQEKIFKKAQRARSLIVKKATEIFEKYDALIMPTTLEIAPKIDDKISNYSYLALANLGGFPSISIPSGEYNKMPLGINIMTKIKDDFFLLSLAKEIENILGGK